MRNSHTGRSGADKTPPPGFPGYRTRTGRSGLDYMDTAREASFMEGKFYRYLFTGRLRTRNPFYLAVMLVAGLALVLPMFGVVVSLIGANRPEFFGLGDLSGMFCPGVFLLFLFTAGAALLVNFYQNVRPGRSGAARLESEEESIQPRRPSIRRKIRYQDKKK